MFIKVVVYLAWKKHKTGARKMITETTMIQFIGISAGGMAIISLVKVFLPTFFKNKGKQGNDK